jgi:glutamate synthase (NADPH/NADH) small chain
VANMNPKKNPMPEQEPLVRNKNFEEVALGYSAETAIDEAKRCLNCKHKPCVSGCPVNVRIPEFIAKVAEGDFDEAYRIITSTNPLPAICGRVCPQETQCEAKCVRGIKGEPVGIGRLERFVADYHNLHGHDNHKNLATPPEPNGHKVAVIGSGPAGLTCAGDLARQGYEVTIFEAFHKPGGVLVYGIPEFRLPKSVVAMEIRRLEHLGVKVVTNAVIGRCMSIDDLFAEGFEAVFIGSGAGLPQFLNIPGENLLGVYSANEYLTRINLMKAYLPEYDTPIKRSKNVAVIGGGNVAMDAARCAKRMGAENVYIVYRRSMNEMPARAEEVHHALEEEIEFKILSNPVAILGNEQGRIVGLECVKMELGECDASGRCRPIEIKGSNFVIDVDTVIIAIGTSPNPLLTSTTKGLETNKWGCIMADENMVTSREGVFAGGDAVTGAATVILAAGAGKAAARSIVEYIEGKGKK